MGGRNIGDLLTAARIPWGAFMGGFDLKIVNPDGSTGCDRQSPATPAHGGPINDYLPHHAFFQYWKSTANFSHARPSVPPAQYGINGDAANHQYDIHDFLDALNAGNLPAVNFLKAPAAMDGHAGYSDPLLEQRFIVNTVNAIQRSASWKSTAIIVLYDDSDGWYDHQMGPVVNPSAVPPAAGGQARESDQLNGPGKCGNGVPLKNDNGVPIEGRCGYGMRQPFLVISPYAKRNFVDHTLIDQSSVIRFIEDNWGLKRIGNGSFDALGGPITSMFDFSHKCSECRLILDPETGEPQSVR
jgi:phospholipase C